MDMVNKLMLLATSMKENGKKIENMDQVYGLKLME